MKKSTLKIKKIVAVLLILTVGLMVPTKTVKAYWVSDNGFSDGTEDYPYVLGKNVKGVFVDGIFTISAISGEFTYPPDGTPRDAICTACGENYLDGKNVVINNGIKELCAGAFYYYKIRSVSIPSSVTTIGESAFGLCAFISEITFPESGDPLTIGKNAFKGCQSLRDVSLSNRITTISEGMFYQCTGLQEITIPSSVTSIGSEAFYNCDSLSSVTFEETSGSISIDTTAFSYCSRLNNIVIKNATDANEIKTLLNNMATSTGKSIDSFTSIKVPEEYVSAIRTEYPNAKVKSCNPPVETNKTEESKEEVKASEGTPTGPSKSVYEEKMDSIIKDINLLISNASGTSDNKKSAGGKKTLYLKDVTSLSLSVMKTLKNNPNVNLDMTYTYKGIGFHIVIPGGTSVFDESIPWYGPLWLYAHFGQGAALNTVNTTVNVYSVQSGDTLRKIAARYGMTLEELLKKNPQIKNLDKISIGDKINL